MAAREKRNPFRFERERRSSAQAEVAKWVAFAERHRDALQRGGFRAYRPDANYPLLENWSETERIFAVYDSHMAVPLPEDDGRRVLVVNATASARVLVETADGVRGVPSEPYAVVEVRCGVRGDCDGASS